MAGIILLLAITGTAVWLNNLIENIGKDDVDIYVRKTTFWAMAMACCCWTLFYVITH